MAGYAASWRAVLRTFVALVLAGIALGQLQGLLQGMHVSDRPARSIGSLNHLIHAGPDPKVTAGVVGVWKEYSDANASAGAAGSSRTANAHEVASWAVAVDAFLFAPLYALGLFLVFLRARSDRADHAPLAYAGMGLIAAGFLADEVENYANLKIVRYAWKHGENTASASAFHDLTWVLWLAGWFKWVLVLTAVVIALVLVWVMFAETIIAAGGAWTGFRRRVHLLRFQLILVGLIAFVPFAHEQIADLIRRWSTRQLGLTALLAWMFAITTWFAAWRLLIRGQWQTGWPAKHRRRVGWILVGSLVGLATIQALADYLTRHELYRPGWGLVVPAVILTALGGLGLLMPDPPADLASPPSGAPLAPEATHPRLPRLLASFSLVAFGLGIVHASFGYSVYVLAWTWRGSSLLALGLVVAGVVGARLLRQEPLLGGLAGAVAGLVVLGFADSGDVTATVLVGAGILFVFAGWRLFDVLGNMTPPQPAIFVPVTLGLALYVGVALFPFDTGKWIGGVGVLFAFVVLLTWVGALLVWLTPAIPVPRPLVMIRIRRFPLLALLIVWFLAASHFDPGGYHDVRLKDAKVAASGVKLGAAWRCWLGKNGFPDGRKAHNPCAPAGTSTNGRATRPIPLFLVATTGGGIRAAYWTDLVLDCAFEVRKGATCPTGEHASDFARSDRLFALSGISGGSLGLAEYAAYLAEKERKKTEDNWVQRALDADSLSASGAWWLFVELPRVFLQFRSPTDRAAILERGWERQWPHGELGRGLLELWRTAHHQPLLLLNGTSVQDGCRFETSPLDVNVETPKGTPPGCKSTQPFDEGPPGTPPNVSRTSVLPATRDLTDFLCGDSKDVRLSTAALLSGRFPFVNPAARVAGRCPHGKNVKAPVAFVVDGGYLDTSGASPINEAMTRLQPFVDAWNRNHRAAGGCIVPVLIQIDNGFSSAPKGPSRPGELLVPLTTLFATRGAREAEARVGAALDFSGVGTNAGDRWAHFVNEAHPGPKAPLGWTESRVSERELVGQLKVGKNQDAFKKVGGWIEGRGLSCPATP
jgi:hypothetical protein